MYIFCHLAVIFTLFFAGSLQAENKARLQYSPNLPVALTSTLSLVINQALPGLSLATKGTQELTAVLSLNGGPSDTPQTKPPFDLMFILKGLKIDLRANDVAIIFDSSDKESSPFLKQLSRVLDTPVKIRVGEKLNIEMENSTLSQIMQTLPYLQEVHPEKLLADIFLHPFALAGEQLEEGKTYVRTFEEGAVTSLPASLSYTITAIDDYKVYADIDGKIEKKSLELSGKVRIDDKEQELVSLSLSGTLKGKGWWNRDNAMLNDVDLEYDYVAIFKLAEWDWRMNIRLHASNITKLN